MTSLADLSWVEVPCALCGGEGAKRVARIARYAVPLVVVRCTTCGHVRLSPRPADEDLGKLYDEDYYTGDGEGGEYAYADERARPEVVGLRAEARLRRIEEDHAPGRLLEVGCAFGALLEAAAGRGWEVAGVDLSEYAVASCRERGLDVTPGTLEAADLPAARYDVVYLSETAEHLPYPVETFRAAHRVLAPGGTVVVATANHDSLARLLRGRRWGYYMPGHLQYFSARSLAAALDISGLRVRSRFFGDSRTVADLRKIRRASAVRGSTFGDVLKRISFRGFSVGAGMVLHGRKEP